MSLKEPQIRTSLVNETEKINSHYPTKCQYYFKYESEQPSGSFKLRGIGHFIGKQIDKSRKEGFQDVHVFSSSGGNAGLAAASRLQLESYGATVLIKGEHWGEANAFLQTYAMEDKSKGQYPILCHPFDHPLIWEGHSTMIDEIVQELGTEKLTKLKGIVCSVGGGGLYCGIVEGLKRNNLNNVTVLAVETKPAPTFSKAIEANNVVTLESVKTIATSLASPHIASEALKNYNSHPTKVELMDDSDAVKGTIDYYEIFNKVTEPACGVTIATALSRSDFIRTTFWSIGE
ncbi:unnamed protein product [Wickerhamomyces anomalus]